MPAMALSWVQSSCEVTYKRETKAAVEDSRVKLGVATVEVLREPWAQESNTPGDERELCCLLPEQLQAGWSSEGSP